MAYKLRALVINLFTLLKRLFFEPVHKISRGFVLKKLSIRVWIFLSFVYGLLTFDLRLQREYT